MNSNASTKQAFTLIELLVVVAIIGILSSIVLASLSNAKDKAKMAKKNAHYSTIRADLERYYIEHGRYPSDSGSISPICLGQGYADSKCAFDGVELVLDTTNASNNPNIALREDTNTSIFKAKDDPIQGDKAGISYDCTTSSCQDYILKWFIITEKDDCSFGIKDININEYTKCLYKTQDN